ncbi:hypothetical protein MUY27_14690 [Mucilaginibacter sp. RS28]|uniref:Uncharacterized protein n=1 Tax=Mucilaginibacter straminoryzae TaxID=2932774 RepID=A0A9X2BE25_9SPHI|nr:hypothetical protein [Mucilaginibacter straminoryzae]MCJ8210963.1 hypothetical protein [Mucilaginibacter straminoryzae]
MTLDFFAELLLGSFTLIFGIWLFKYILKQSRKSGTKNIKLYTLSIIFILIGVSMIFATLMTLDN